MGVGRWTLLLCAAAAHAGPRTSANYNVPADTADAGGKRTASASYTNDGSLGAVVGLSTVAAPAETAKHGYIGQLTEVTSLAVSAAPTSVDEGSTRQLTATATLDDTTNTVLTGQDVAWSVVSGPISFISSGGLASAANVYQNTAASVQGAYLGSTSPIGLTVLNIGFDDFGTYAGDMIDDDWQVAYFGANNPAAAPTQDPDGDGGNNLFEFTAGLLPNDPTSRFYLRIEPVVGQPNQQQLFFRPIVAGRTYILKSSSDLSVAFTDLPPGLPTANNGDERSVTDTSATGFRKFYKVSIAKP